MPGRLGLLPLSADEPGSALDFSLEALELRVLEFSCWYLKVLCLLLGLKGFRTLTLTLSLSLSRTRVDPKIVVFLEEFGFRFKAFRPQVLGVALRSQARTCQVKFMVCSWPRNEGLGSHAPLQQNKFPTWQLLINPETDCNSA